MPCACRGHGAVQFVTLLRRGCLVASREGDRFAVPSCMVDRAGIRWQDIDGDLAMHHFSLRSVPWRALGCLRAPLVRGQSLRDGRLPKGLVDGFWVVIYFAGKQGCGCCEFSVVDDAIRASLRMMRTCIL